MDSLLLRIITLSMALIALPFIDDGLGVDALNAQQSQQATALGRRSAGQRIAAAVASLTPFAVVARPEGVNKPELLAPNGADGKPARVMQMSDVNYLASKQIVRLDEQLKKLEAKTGVKVRVLCQRYPDTQGLAIKDYWGVDDNTVVLVVDKVRKRNGGGSLISCSLTHSIVESIIESLLHQLFKRGHTDRMEARRPM